MKNNTTAAPGTRIVQPPYGESVWRSWTDLSTAQRAQAKVLWPREIAERADGALFLVAESTGRVVRMR